VSAGCVALALSALAASAQTRDPRATTPATAVISGTVVSDDDQQRPVRRARVTCSGGDSGNATAITDDRGRFQFTGLRAGRYTLAARKDAWVPVTYGAKRPMRPGSAIPVAEGQKAEIVIRMLRGSVITGVILDHNNQPAAHTSVAAMHYVMQNGERRLTAAGSTGTDDRGAYRIFGLAPGDYVVRAVVPGSATNASTGELRLIGDRHAGERTVALAPAYYPGTTIATQAVTVSIGRAEERTGIDFTMQLVPTAHVEGIVSLPDGTPAPGGTQVNLLAGSQVAGAGPAAVRSTHVGADGTFAFTDVSPGTYTILARATVPTRPDGPPTMVWSSSEIAVDGERISGLALGLQPGMTVAGHVRFDGTRLKPPADLKSVRVSLVPVQPEGTVALSPSVNGIDTDGRFAITGVTPGRYRLSASFPAAGRPGNWQLRAALIGGQDSLDIPVTIQPSQSISGASILFTDRPADLTGIVHNAAGGAPNEFTVILFSADQSHWIPRARRIQAMRPAADGAYAFRGLPPGEYHLAAIDDVEAGEWFDPAFLQRLLPAAMKLTIGEGEQKVQDIRLGG
jgi:uncharacterized protein (DUF2141 family)